MAASKINAAKTTKTQTSKSHKGDSASSNPFRPQSSYWTVVEALRSLGEKKMHPADKLVKSFPSIMGKEAFAAFKSRDKRNENGKDCEGRIIQNAIVVNRPDYGAPLRQLGWEVRKDRQDGAYLFGLFPCSKQAPAKVKASKTVKTVAKVAGKPPVASKAPAKGKTAPKAVKPSSKAKASKAK